MVGWVKGGPAAWRAWIRRHSLLNSAWRVAVFTAGVIVLLAGIVMLVLPGPGWAAIFVGFAILATEFAWAQSVLASAKRTARRAKERALDPRTRRRNQALAVAGGVVVAAAILTYLAFFGLGPPG
jgi:uncharacterized protein (TIGR02611 family)